MEFPVTIESQDDFDRLVSKRLEREQAKQADLETQVASLTEANQALETKASELEGRATTAEQWKADRETKDQLAQLTVEVAKEAGLPEGAANALKGATKEELLAHAEALKPLLTPTNDAKVFARIGDTPTPKQTADTETREAVRQLFGGDA